ncbi:MAG TPA: tetratricopeptide repeat protein [Saprospiraceae bacterium]|nr:tetratricopeptide repeat protein [Saprospiraceae bacterium]
MKKNDFINQVSYVTLIILALMLSMANCKSFNLQMKGQHKMNHEDYDEAIKCFNSSIELDSLFPGTYMNRAFCYMRMGKFEEALKDADKSIKINKKDDCAYFCRAQIKEAKGDMQGALKDYNRAIYRNKYKYCYYNYCGKVLANLSHYEQALVYIDFALKTQAYDECSTKKNYYTLKKCVKNIVISS